MPAAFHLLQKQTVGMLAAFLVSKMLRKHVKERWKYSVLTLLQNFSDSPFGFTSPVHLSPNYGGRVAETEMGFRS